MFKTWHIFRLYICLFWWITMDKSRNIFSWCQWYVWNYILFLGITISPSFMSEKSEKWWTSHSQLNIIFCRWMSRFWWLYIMFLLIKMRVNILITSWWDDWTSITNSCIQAIDSQPGVVFYTEVIRILWFRIRSPFVLVKPIHLLAVYLYVFL
jgi:hypothetical protein